MERILIAYNLYRCDSCRQGFLEKLSEEGFEVIEINGLKKVRSQRKKEEGPSIPLGQIGEDNFIVYNETNRMSTYDISERTRLVMVCDRYKH